MSSLYDKHNKTFEIFKRILFCTMGAVIIGFNIKSFVRTGGLFPGGFAGITLLIQRSLDTFMDIHLSYTLIYIPLNMIPIYIGIKWLGKNFTFYSIYVIVLSSIVVDILPDIVLTYDILLIAIFGGIINGVAIWICLLVGASAGGTDFISIYFSEKKGKDAWNYILLGNVFVLTVAGILFGVDKAMYSIIFQFCTTQVIQNLFKQYRKHTLLIITNEPASVYGRIKTITHHDATLFMGVGMYQGSQRQMIYSVVGSDEVDAVLNAIKEVDPKAFINVMKTEQLGGRFYKKPRI